MLGVGLVALICHEMDEKSYARPTNTVSQNHPWKGIGRTNHTLYL
ncbi:hypothetical protein P4643_26595 [Priestia megaterium]|nr:hypothetical protein [Priestia megaterium]